MVNLNDFEVTASGYDSEVSVRHTPCDTESDWMPTPFELAELAFWAEDHLKTCIGSEMAR